MRIYIALGTNLGDREQNMNRAIELIEDRLGHVAAVSSFYETEPVGFRSENAFLNAAAAIDAPDDLTPHHALRLTQEIEREMGRTEKSHNGIHTDRLIDIDLLLFGNTLVESDELTLPHPHMHERRFVMDPLAEIAPEAVHPLFRLPIGEMQRRLTKCLITPLTPERCTAQTAEAMNRLLRQLTTHPTAHTAQSLLEIAQCQQTVTALLYAPDGTLAATATLCLCHQLTGLKAWVEDVVVDERFRGQHFGKWLVEWTLWAARRRGATTANLTSRPTREAANRLYRQVGFERRETNVYKMDL